MQKQLTLHEKVTLNRMFTDSQARLANYIGSVMRNHADGKPETFASLGQFDRCRVERLLDTLAEIGDISWDLTFGSGFFEGKVEMP